AEDGIRDRNVTGVQTCALPIFDGEQTRGDVESDALCSRRHSGHVGIVTVSEQDLRPMPATGKGREQFGVGDRGGEHESSAQLWRSEERRVGKEWRYVERGEKSR